MRSSMLGLMASFAVAIASAQVLPTCVPAPEDLLPCGNAFYVPSQYNCYYGTKLCPIEYGQPTQPCGEDCYLPSMYSCNNGLLTPPVPSNDNTSIDGTFLVFAFTSNEDSDPVQASGLVFRIGGSPSVYCPDQVRQSTGCPAGTDTVWTCASGRCGLNVQVPGGQSIYISPNGAVSYTQAHSGYAPPGSQFDGFSVDNGELQFDGLGFLACPSADGSSAPQLYSEVQQVSGCYSVKLVTSTGDPGFGAWQYI